MTHQEFHQDHERYGESDTERLENDWFEFHGDRIKALAKSYKVLMSHPTLKNDLVALEIGLVTAIDSMDWKCPNGSLDAGECYTLAQDYVKDWMK